MEETFECEKLEDMEDLIQDEEDVDGVEIARYAITSYRTDRSVDNLIKWKTQGKLCIPNFQRDYVWKYKTCVKLIESILLGLPIPDLFVYKEVSAGGEKYHLIDGYQRISTIEDFKKGIWKEGSSMERRFKITNKQSKWYGKTYDTLSQEDKDFFDDYIFSLTIFDSPEKKESKKKLYMTEVFERINTGSMKLSEQEVRNAVYSGIAIEKIKEIAKGHSFVCLTQNDQRIADRKKDEEIILRFATYYLAYTRYKKGKNSFYDSADTLFSSSKNEMLSNFLYFSNKNNINYEEILIHVADALNYIATFDPDAFYARSRDNTNLANRVHEILAEALIISAIELKTFSKDANYFELLKKHIWEEETTRELFTTATTSLDNVEKRTDYLKSRLQ